MLQRGRESSREGASESVRACVRVCAHACVHVSAQVSAPRAPLYAHLLRGSFMEEAPARLFPRWMPPASAGSESLKYGEEDLGSSQSSSHSSSSPVAMGGTRTKTGEKRNSGCWRRQLYQASRAEPGLPPRASEEHRFDLRILPFSLTVKDTWETGQIQQSG